MNQHKGNFLPDEYEENPKNKGNFVADEYQIPSSSISSRGNFVPEKNKEIQKPEEETTAWQRAKNYFTQGKFGEALSYQMQSGGPSGAPSLSPEQAKEVATQFGTIVAIEGAFAPIAWLAKSSPYLPRTLEFFTNRARAAAIGAGIPTAESLVNKGELPSTGEVVGGAASGLILDLAIAGAGAGVGYLSKLRPAQQAKNLAGGQFPNDLDPTNYKFFMNEVVPEMIKKGENDLKFAEEAAISKQNFEYNNKLSNVKAQHEHEMLNLQKENKTSQEEYFNKDLEYKNKLRQLESEHQNNLDEITKANEQTKLEFDSAKREFDQLNAREQLAQNTLNNINRESQNNLQGRVSPGGERLNQQPVTQPAPNSLEGRIGNIFSDVPKQDSYTMGRDLTGIVRAHDRIDYRFVNQAYQRSREANIGINEPHADLVNHLSNRRRELMSIPKRTPPQETMLNTIDTLLPELSVLDEHGYPTGELRPFENQRLLDQASALRYNQDFDFAHANVKGVFNPTINALQDAAETAAITIGREDAALANRAARSQYAEWANLYDNDYVRPYRDLNNHSMIENFDKSQKIDNFRVLDRVLSRSNTGQQFSNQIRKSIVNNSLENFYSKPNKAVGKEFNEKLMELRPILRPGEERQIINNFADARRQPEIFAKKIPKIEKPKGAETKPYPESVKIPLNKNKPPVPKVIEKVEIPLKGKLKETPEMKIASQRMKITPEEAIKLTETPTGMDELKEGLGNSNEGKQLYRKVEQYIIKDIHHSGEVKKVFTGRDLKKAYNAEKNFNRLEKMMGKEEALDLINAAEKIEENQVTVDNLKKYVKKAATIKTALALGII